MPVDGAVLCGGAGRRIGGQKESKLLGGRPLLDWMLAKLTPVCVRAFVVGLKEQRKGLEAVPDDFPGEGPLGGLITALRHCNSERLLVLPVDLPLLKPEVVRELSERGGDSVPMICDDGRPQPLVGSYPKRVLAGLEQVFQEGERRLTPALESCGYESLGPEKLRLLDPELEGFLNVNRSQDLERALSLLEAARRNR